jgi:spore coat polysaccharide biosynthesis predicted glycosyltransferase SpsG/2-C-methyl-D-erythritol 4-phosphate cytidylyltransferase
LKDGRRVIAVLPARGGTDRVPYLNVKRLGDRPLLAWTIEAAQLSGVVDRLVVSTDDAAVAETARAHGAEAPFLRPKELASDIPSLKPVIAHAVAEIEKQGERFDVVLVLQATSPFRGGDAIRAAVEKLLQGGFDSVLSVSEERELRWRAEGETLVPLFDRAGRREEQAPVYKENGAVVALRREVLDRDTRFGERVSFLPLDKRAGFTVRDLDDFWMAERLLREPRVLFRVDGSTEMGMGHVYRSLAIADALRDTSRASVAFLMTARHSEGLKTVAQYGYPVRLAGEASLGTYLELIRDYAPDILINDLPGLDAAYLEELSHLGTTTVNLVDTLDDLERTEAYAQVIVSVMSEERETPENFYGGPAYAILRRHFRDTAKQKEIRAEPRLVVLTFGGSDPQGLTLKAARALSGLGEGLEVVAVAGPAFSYQREFEALQASLGRRVPLMKQLEGHIADLMFEADLVLCSGGMTVYEIAALGTPGLVLAQNTREEARMRAFARRGSIEFLGLGTALGEAEIAERTRSLLADVDARRRMSERGRAMVDGMGAERTAELVLGSARAKESEARGR